MLPTSQCLSFRSCVNASKDGTKWEKIGIILCVAMPFQSQLVHAYLRTVTWE